MPIRFLVYDTVVVLSGVTTVLPTLAEQMSNILPRIAGSLNDAGSSWDRVARVSFYLHRSQQIETLNENAREFGIELYGIESIPLVSLKIWRVPGGSGL